MLYTLFIAGIVALRDYVATHVLTCLVPAFFLAGAMVTFINRQSVLMYLGGQASKPKSFTLASVASFFIAACSCTVIPVSSGLYYAGAGIGVAFIILWVAPAANILALVYTGNILGSELLIARVIAALFMAYVVGYVMSWLFRNEGLPETNVLTQGDMEKAIGREEIILILLLALTLLLPNYLVTEGAYVYKVGVWGIGSLITAAYAFSSQNRDRLMEWMRETWWFVKTIFPLLLGGVFLVGVLGEVLPGGTHQKISWGQFPCVIICRDPFRFGDIFRHNDRGSVRGQTDADGHGKRACLGFVAHGAGIEPAQLASHRKGVWRQKGFGLCAANHHVRHTGGLVFRQLHLLKGDRPS